MNKWLRRIRGAVGMGLTWATGAALLGFGIELIHNVWPNPLGSLVDIWPAALAIPAFFGGLSLVPAAMAAVGLATLNVPAWQLTAAIAGPLTLVGSATSCLRYTVEGKFIQGRTDPAVA